MVFEPFSAHQLFKRLMQASSSLFSGSLGDDFMV
jgi:hypothetical protein